MEYWNMARRAAARVSPVLRHSNTPTVHSLFTMWQYPRLVVWFILTTVLAVLVRLPFIRVQLIPHYLDFHPGIVLVPLAGLFFGPAGAWGALAGSLLGDRLFGPWNGAVLYRALGAFLFALGTQRLWTFSFHPEGDPPQATDTWNRTLRFVLVAWAGCFVAAAWQALGMEVRRMYPFAYVVSLLALNNLLFCALLGVPLYQVMVREWIPHFGTWQGVMGIPESEGRITRRNALFIFIGSVGACLAGLYVSSLFYRVGPLQPFVLGSTTGIGVTLMVVPFLLLQAWGVFKR